MCITYMHFIGDKWKVDAWDCGPMESHFYDFLVHWPCNACVWMIPGTQEDTNG